MLKTESDISKTVVANRNFPSSKKLIEGLKDKNYFGFLNLKSSASCGFIFVCSISLSANFCL